jgi:hypothetical protein
MAKPKTLDAKISALTRTVEKGFAALAHDIAHRPTNSDVASIIENYIPGIVKTVVPPLLDERRSGSTISDGAISGIST